MYNTQKSNTRLILLGIILLASLLFGSVWVAQAATIIYVRPDGDDANCDGTINAAYPGSGGPNLACAVKTIQKGIDLVDIGGTVSVQAGTYTEAITLDKQITLLGAGSTELGTIITNSAAVDSKVGVIQVTGSGTSLNSLKVQNVLVKPVGLAGISVGRFTEATGVSVNYLELENVFVIGTGTNGCTEQERGLYVDLTSSIDHLTISNSAFNNLAYGWYIQKQVSAETSTVSNVEVSNTSFYHNIIKGIYSEKLSDANFTSIVVDQNGYDATLLSGCSHFQPWMAGIDLNLKAGTYQNITIDQSSITNNGLGGAKEGVGLAIKGRGTGNDPSYQAFPAMVTNITLTNNTITGNERGIRLGEPGKTNTGPTNVVVYHNTLANNIQTYSGVDGSAYGDLVNQSTNLADAENNYWGTTIAAQVVTKIYGSADYQPWCNSDFTICTYTLPVHNLTQSTDHLTIQAGIDAALTGDEIHIDPGIYVENVLVTKGLKLVGAGVGNTTIHPAASNPNPCSGSSLCGSITAASNVIGIQASDVTVQDLTVDGDNPGLTSGIVRAGADLDARNGIITDHSLGLNFNNLEVHHVEVKNIYLRGMYASTNGTFNFHHNLVTNVQGDGYSIGMFAWYGPGTMADNTVSYANDAISANHSKGIQFLNNVVTHSGSGVHTDNSGDGGGVADVIQGNTVSDCAPGGYGIWVFVAYLPPTIDQNTVTNCSVGLSAWGQGASVNQLFTNNIVDGEGLAGSVGVYVTTDIISWGYRDITVSFNNNEIKNNEVGLQFAADQQSWNPEPFEAKTITATFYNNAITGNTNPATKDTQGFYSLNASGNWWGTNVPADVKTAVNGGVGIDYTPWLNGGTDTGDPGFRGDFSSLWVDDDSPQTGSTGRINEALGMVSGSTVNIAPGTYAETVATTIDGLTITGSDVNDRPVITGGMNVNTCDAITLRNLVVKGVGSGSFVIGAGGVGFTMDHVTVDGENVAGRMGVGGGQVNGDISITHSEFLNIKGWAAFDTRSGSGGPTSGADINSFVFSNNTVRNTQGHINARGTLGDPALTVTFSDNLVEQVGAATNSFGGILKAFYAVNASFTGNIIKDVGTSGYSPAGEAAYGAGIMPRNVQNLTITGNTFENNNQAIAVEPRNSVIGGFPDGVLPAGVMSNNTFTGNKYGLYIPATLNPSSNFNNLAVNQNNFSGSTTEAVHNGSAAGVLNAELNWWGAACGPTGTGGADAVSANVDYNPWWTAPGGPGTSSTGSGGELIFPAGSSTSSMQAIVDCAAPNSTLLYESGSYPGGLIVNTNGLTFKLNTVSVGPGSPAFTINADDVTILGPGVLNGGGSTDPAILVNGGADNFMLQNAQITGWANAVKLAGSVNSFKLISNWIHSNSSHGLWVDSGATLGGVVTIQGNLFKVNAGNGVQNDGPAGLKAEYNSWGDVSGPTGPSGDGIGGNVDAVPFTFAEVYLDMDPGNSGDQYQRNVYETQVFDVSLNVQAANLYGVSFSFSYDPAMLTLNDAPIFEAPWAGKCIVPPGGSPAGTIAYICNLTGGAAWNGGKLASFNFTAQPGAAPNGPWQTLVDLASSEVNTSAGATGGVKVFVNNAGFNAPSSSARDITDGNDGQLDITGIARFKGYIDLEGRGNDSGAVIKVYDASTGTTVLAQGGSASSGAYLTAYQGSNVLQVGTKYYFSVDRDLYLPTAVLNGPWDPNAILSLRPDTSLSTLLLLGGDATNDNLIDALDAGCIGGAYGNSGAVCGLGGSSDVNGDGIVNLYDLVLMGGNYNLTYSNWTP